MNIVDRVASIAEWPTSQRVLLLGSAGIAATAVLIGVNSLVHRLDATPMLDLALLNRYVGVWLLFQCLATALSLPAARAGREGVREAYAFTLIQSIFVAGLLWLFGTMATPLVAIFPSIVILWTLYLGPRYGLFGGLSMLLGILLALALDTHGALPYAPVLLARDLGAQQALPWSATQFSHILVLGSICMLLCLGNLHSQRVQAARLRTLHRMLERSHRLVQRYVPAQLAARIDTGDHDETSRPERRVLSIVFIDVEGFTAMSEQRSPEQLAAILNRYLSEMVALVDAHGGTLNQIIGDGIMVFFGAPGAADEDEAARAAVRMAQAMQQRMAALAGQWSAYGLEQPLRIRIGINTGPASVGDFGPEGRKLYSGIGLHTNLAARVQAHCAPGEVLITESTWTRVREQLPTQARGEVCLKGLTTPVRIYAVAAPAADAPPAPAAQDPALPLWPGMTAQQA